MSRVTNIWGGVFILIVSMVMYYAMGSTLFAMADSFSGSDKIIIYVSISMVFIYGLYQVLIIGQKDEETTIQ